MKYACKILLFFFGLLALCLIVFRTDYIASAKSVSEIQEEIKKYEQEIQRLSSQSKTLAGQIAQFNAQIKLTTLKISQTEEKISLLGGRIDQLEISLDALIKAFSNRAVETYKMARGESVFFLLISSEDLNQAVSRFHYLQKIQGSDRDLLEKLQRAQSTYISEKEDQESLQKELEKQKTALNNQKAAKASLLAVTQSDEKKYQRLLAEAKSQLAALRRFVVSQGGASILQNQTKCDGWGCYYNQRDAQWGNIAMGGSPYSVAEYGCLISSVSMIASHYGRNIKPGDIAAVASAFVPETGYLYDSFSANGIAVTKTKVNRDSLDSELNAGRPVIAGLYSGPDHFIVILRKEGDKYIMHDPFLENGNNRPLGDKYSVSDITSLRLISFN